MIGTSCKPIESQENWKVARDSVEVPFDRPFKQARQKRRAPGALRGARPAFAGAGRVKLSTKFNSLEPVNCFALVGDDLSLPKKGNGH